MGRELGEDSVVERASECLERHWRLEQGKRDAGMHCSRHAMTAAQRVADVQRRVRARCQVLDSPSPPAFLSFDARGELRL